MSQFDSTICAICNSETEHRLYHAIGITCPCFLDWLTGRIIRSLIPKEVEQIHKGLMSMPVSKTAWIMSLVATADSANAKTLMIELGTKIDLYIRLLGYHQPEEAEKEKQKFRERGIEV